MKITCPHCGKTAAEIVQSPDKTSAPPSQSWLTSFIRDRCILAEGARVSSPDLHVAFNEWRHGRRELATITDKRLGIEVKKLPGIDLARSRGIRFYTGIALR